jgi:hypothetical protein
MKSKIIDGETSGDVLSRPGEVVVTLTGNGRTVRVRLSPAGAKKLALALMYHGTEADK